VANRLDGKVAAVTGGDQGIGRAIVERLAQEGADVALCYRSNKAGADEVVSVLQKMGRKAAAMQCDVGKVADGQKFIADALAALGRVDILVNNAGLERRADFWDVTETDYDTVLDVNLKAPFFLVQQLLPLLRKASTAEDPARVINVGSIAGIVPMARNSYAYAASKAGLHHLTQILARHLAPDINVNAIAPGAFETRMIEFALQHRAALEAQVPRGTVGQGDDIAGVAIFLASRAGSYVTGTVIPVDGGLSLRNP